MTTDTVADDQTVHPTVDSVFRHVTARYPHLELQTLGKRTLIGLSWAIEDEFCARAERPILFGAFQKRKYWERSRPRWERLARISEAALVMADFNADESDQPARADGLVRVPIRPGSPMNSEWIVVCDSFELPGALLAREVPGQQTIPDLDRLFDSVWTTDPIVVREASRSCAQWAAGEQLAAAAPLLYHLAGQPRPSSVAPADASRLFNRVLLHLDAANRNR